MKRKIVLGLAIYSVVFSLAGVYVIQTIRTATTELDKLITLHQVEILREHYLLQIKKVPSWTRRIQGASIPSSRTS
jgi:CHASE3 domain sensor protein